MNFQEWLQAENMRYAEMRQNEQTEMELLYARIAHLEYLVNGR